MHRYAYMYTCSDTYTHMHIYAYMYTCIDTQVHFELIPAGSAWVQQGGGNDVSNAVTSKANGFTSKANGFTSTAGDAGPGLTSACERFFWPEWDSSAFAAPRVPGRHSQGQSNSPHELSETMRRPLGKLSGT